MFKLIKILYNKASDKRDSYDRVLNMYCFNIKTLNGKGTS